MSLYLCVVNEASVLRLAETPPNMSYLQHKAERRNLLFFLIMTIEKNVIYQVSGADLKEFAELLIANAQNELTQAKEETYLSRESVAKMLDVDKSTLWRWAKTGYLVPVTIGAKIRYRRSDIDNLLKAEEDKK